MFVFRRKRAFLARSFRVNYKFVYTTLSFRVQFLRMNQKKKKKTPEKISNIVVLHCCKLIFLKTNTNIVYLWLVIKLIEFF